MAIKESSDGRVPFVRDPEGLWSTPLRGAERAAVRHAFERDRDLRPEVENLLRGFGADLRSAFVRAFARGLLAEPARPAGALLPALEETVGMAIGRPKRHTARTQGKSDR